MARPTRLFLARLALALGRTYSELVRTMTAAELVDIWLPLERIDGPWGQVREDMRAAIVASAAGGGRPSDYMPRWWRPEGTDSAEQAEYEAVRAAFRLTADRSS